MKIFKNGIITGLVLQLAIGPVFFFVINLTLQRSIWDGLLGTVALTLVDCFYIVLAILGVGKLLENKKSKKVFGIISSLALIIFGFIIIKTLVSSGMQSAVTSSSASLFSSFSSVFLLTLSSPMGIVYNTSVFAAKALEYNYTKKELFIFGFGVAMAALLFMGSSVLVFSLIKEAVPVLLIQILNMLVGGLLVGYGGVRLWKSLRNN